MSLKPEKIQFNGGELSPWLQGRIDSPHYHKTAKLCRNFIPMTEGSLKRRGGTTFVAQTPEIEEMTLVVETYPPEAEVMLNHISRREIQTAYGDEVIYDVHADGYNHFSGTILMTKNQTITVTLVPIDPLNTVEIVPYPPEATVLINGYIRSKADFALHEQFDYLVYHEGYEPVYQKALCLNSQKIKVQLVPTTESGGTFGTWGKLIGFGGCSLIGSKQRREKCFMLKFENGYLPIVFDALQSAPQDFDENLFISSKVAIYNSLAEDENGVLTPSFASIYKDNLVWENQTVQQFFAKTELENMTWPVENEQFVLFFDGYRSVVVNQVLTVFYQGQKVWTFKERKQ